jgi:hypothetical protein
VGEGDEGGDAGGEEVVAELGVVVNAGLVDGVVPAALGDDAGPGEGEAVGLGAEGLEEGDVLGGAVVGVAGGLAGAAVGDLSGDLAEGVPDTGATSILVNGTLDLVAGGGLAEAFEVGHCEGVFNIRGRGKAPDEVAGKGSHGQCEIKARRNRVEGETSVKQRQAASSCVVAEGERND